MSIEVYRIDDRLVHGQVVVGWGQPMGLAFIVLVDDQVAASDWEQELYRMGVPPEMTVHFESVANALARLEAYRTRSEAGLLLTGGTATMRALVEGDAGITRVNVGGLHHRAGRSPRLRYVFLDSAEEADLRAIDARGVDVSAQDVPGAVAVPLAELLARSGG
ncbi:MAG: PTS sugar transporter subunit IIB [Gemmatimonadaceae bacterium]|nr:PTS sugar transporter subunit IIB [Gemmatimonadaceae bacterium]